MYKEVLRSIDGVSIYPILSLTIFFIFFTGLMIKVALMKKKDVQELSSMPLSDDIDEPNETFNDK